MGVPAGTATVMLSVNVPEVSALVALRLAPRISAVPLVVPVALVT